MVKDIYIQGFGFCLGEQIPMGELSMLAKDTQRKERFVDMGFEHFLYAPESAVEMGLKAIDACLSATNCDAKDIDLVVWCSNTLDDKMYYRDIHQGFQKRGLANAFPVGVHGTFCGNLGTGIRLVRSLFISGDIKSALIVCSDKNQGLDEKARLLEPAVAVTSDGASCMKLSVDTGPYRILNIHQIVNHSMADLEIDDIYEGTLKHKPAFMRYSFESFKGRKRAAEEFYEKSNTLSKEYRWLVTNNYGMNTLLGFASEAGVDKEKLYSKNISRTGHVQSTDNLLNISTLEEESLAQEGDKILMLSTGPYSWGFWSLERTGSSMPPSKNLGKELRI